MNMAKLIKKLNENWKIKKDPKNIGVKKSWFNKKIVEDKSADVSIPWQCYGDDYVDYTGYLWYQKSFTLNSEDIASEKELMLEFEAVDYIADIWLNGHYLGSHEGGYIPFKFRTGEYLNLEDNNILTVRVFDPEDNREIPHGKQGSWYTRVSGIWQDVNLKEVSLTHIKKVFFDTDIDNNQLNIDLRLNKWESSDARQLNLKIFSPKAGEKIILEKKFTVENDRKKLSVNIDEPYLWSPEDPNLYDVEIELLADDEVIDSYSDYFGMRKVELKNDQIYLNNEKFYMRGALDQAFWPEKIYKASSKEDMIDELKKAKKMGFNLIRKHIKTPLPEYLELADRMGMLIWEEAANYSKWTKQARQRFKREYTEMVKRDYNHPSIIIWSIYNEEWGLEWDLANDPKKQKWVADFYDYAKELDQSRIICDNSGWAHVKTDINDYHRYFATPENSKEWSEDLDKLLDFPEKNFVEGYEPAGEAVIMSEFGMWGLPTYSLLISNYKDYPNWFEGSAAIFNEDFKIPETLEKNYEHYNFKEIFADYDEISAAAQKREFTGVKYQIEEMRKRKEKGLSGYVVTELTDIEWETNGFLDYFRNYKYDLEKIQAFNADLIVSLELEKINLWEDEDLKVKPYLINDKNRPVEAELIIKLNDSICKKEEIKIKANSVEELAEFSIKLPEVKSVEKLSLEAVLKQNERILNKNSENIIVAAKNIIKNKNKEYLNQKSAENIIVTDKLDKEKLKSIWEGSSALFLAEAGAEITDKSLFNFKKLKKGESWDKAASFHFLNTDELDENKIFNKISTWELKNIFPDYTIDNIDDLYFEKLFSGYFSGWLGRLGATTVRISYGSGNIIATTLKLKDNYSVQPSAALLFNRLISILEKEG